MTVPDISAFSVEAVWEGALRLLEEVGLEVGNPRVLRRAAAELRVEGGSVRFPRPVVEHYAEEIRARERDRPPPGRGPLSIHNGGVHYQYLDAATGQVRDFDTPSLAQHARLIYRLREEGVFHGGTPGYPLDVPGPLQFLTQYYIDCLYNPRPGSAGLAPSVEAARFHIEAARIMGVPHTFGTEMISPLRFHGSSVDIALELYEPGMGVVTDPMPILGVTAPLDWHAGWSLSVAENLGSYVLYRLCGLDNVTPTFRLFVPNLATGMISFSSPKHLMALLTRRKVRELFGMSTDAGELLLVSAKRPGEQAAAEKMAGCMAGALFGFTHLEGAGALYMDVIFSSQQLAVDLEIRDYVRSLEEELPTRELDLVAEVRAGLSAGSFLAADLTLEGLRDFMWRPRLFDLSTLQSGPVASLCERAKRLNVEEKAAEYAYELSGSRREELDRLMERARKALA